MYFYSDIPHTPSMLQLSFTWNSAIALKVSSSHHSDSTHQAEWSFQTQGDRYCHYLLRASWCLSYTFIIKTNSLTEPQNHISTALNLLTLPLASLLPSHWPFFHFIKSSLLPLTAGPLHTLVLLLSPSSMTPQFLFILTSWLYHYIIRKASSNLPGQIDYSHFFSS